MAESSTTPADPRGLIHRAIAHAPKALPHAIARLVLADLRGALLLLSYSPLTLDDEIALGAALAVARDVLSLPEGVAPLRASGTPEEAGQVAP